MSRGTTLHLLTTIYRFANASAAIDVAGMEAEVATVGGVEAEAEAVNLSVADSATVAGAIVAVDAQATYVIFQLFNYLNQLKPVHLAWSSPASPLAIRRPEPITVPP